MTGHKRSPARAWIRDIMESGLSTKAKHAAHVLVESVDFETLIAGVSAATLRSLASCGDTRMREGLAELGQVGAIEIKSRGWGKRGSSSAGQIPNEYQLVTKGWQQSAGKRQIQLSTISRKDAGNLSESASESVAYRQRSLVLENPEGDAAAPDGATPPSKPTPDEVAAAKALQIAVGLRREDAA